MALQHIIWIYKSILIELTVQSSRFRVMTFAHLAEDCELTNDVAPVIVDALITA